MVHAADRAHACTETRDAADAGLARVCGAEVVARTLDDACAWLLARWAAAEAPTHGGEPWLPWQQRWCAALREAVRGVAGAALLGDEPRPWRLALADAEKQLGTERPSSLGCVLLAFVLFRAYLLMLTRLFNTI